MPLDKQTDSEIPFWTIMKIMSNRRSSCSEDEELSDGLQSKFLLGISPTDENWSGSMEGLLRKSGIQMNRLAMLTTNLNLWFWSIRLSFGITRMEHTNRSLIRSTIPIPMLISMPILFFVSSQKHPRKSVSLTAPLVVRDLRIHL